MELSATTIGGLSLLGTASAVEHKHKPVSDAVFKELVQHAFQHVLLCLRHTATQKHTQKALASLQTLLKKHSKIAIQLKQAHAAVVCMILEGSKHDAGKTELAALLEESKISPARRKWFISTFISQKIRSVSWRIDNYLKSKLLEKCRTPLYFVNLRTTASSNTNKQSASSQSQNNVQFAATYDQLQDLLSKCKDAVKQVDHIVNG